MSVAVPLQPSPLRSAPVQSWDLLSIKAPDGTRDPVVLHSADQARAVLLKFEPGQELGEHEVKERAIVAVVDGAARFSADGETVEGGVGTVVCFAPEERHSVTSDSGARLLLVLAPWPGDGHYRAEEADLRRSSGDPAPRPR